MGVGKGAQSRLFVTGNEHQMRSCVRPERDASKGSARARPRLRPDPRTGAQAPPTGPQAPPFPGATPPRPHGRSRGHAPTTLATPRQLSFS